ncbi:mitochondrial ribosomal protein MRP51 [Xylaria cf. heliscus]|nr:mitochondrial ribosomal protein MRP51 [Xylaria cf. heliscus]
MAARSVSPGAALLRSSRMFSMPNPIPASPGDYSSATKHQSATATAPYPTHLSITTPATSRINGDWGLKRPLPLKTTIKQTIPLVRIRQMDSTEHITDFQSASDHTMTLKKFQELNLPISVPVVRENEMNSLASQPTSVFEEDGDITALEPEQARSTENKRWKFNGPWLAGMTDGEFNKWLEKNVRSRRAEFRAYLKETHAKELTEEQTRQAIQDELPVPPEVTPDSITEVQFIEYLRDLRQDRLVLYRHVSRFLDLAPLTTEPKYIASMKYHRSQKFDRPNPYGALGPPITHPSAGLSYLRTYNFIDNHPIYGPQKYHPVVKARVLKPRNTGTGVHDPVIGIAGFVAERPFEQRYLGHAMQNSPRGSALARLELDQRGGAKLYYRADSATVDSSGRLRINISDPAHPAVVCVVQELLGEGDMKMDVYKNSMQDSWTTEISPDITPSPPRRATHMYGSRTNYGLGPDKF